MSYWQDPNDPYNRGPAPAGWNWAQDRDPNREYGETGNKLGAYFADYADPNALSRAGGNGGGNWFTNRGSDTQLARLMPDGTIGDMQTASGGGWNVQDLAIMAGAAYGGQALAGGGVGGAGGAVGGGAASGAAAGASGSAGVAGGVGGGIGGGMATGWAGAAQYGAPILSALLQSKGAGDAADAQRDAANQATGLQRDQFNQVRADAVPWRAAGENALAKLTGLLADGSLTSKFAGMNPQEEAGYKFAAQEGQRAIDNSAAARGGIGGASLKAGARFAQDNANKHYNDAFNRFQTERTNTTNPLFQLAGFGPQANQQVAGAGQNYANQAGANSIFGGRAQAGNNLAQGNIYAGAVNQLAALYGRNQQPPQGWEYGPPPG